VSTHGYTNHSRNRDSILSGGVAEYWQNWTDLTIEQVLMRSIRSRRGLTRGRGVTESARLQWACSMHKCAGVHNAMTTLTDRKHDITDKEHKEWGTARFIRD